MKRKLALIKNLAAIAGLALSTASAQDELISEHGILLLTANGGISPAWDDVWRDGDEYRLIFATSMGIDATSDNIEDYDAFVNAAAKASNLHGGALGDIEWKALVSTPTLAANDHTDTKGVGDISLWLVNGITVVADNYDGLYGTHRNAIKMSETGGKPLDNGAYSSLWTGSDGYGNAVPGYELGAAGGTSRGGLWAFTSGAHWISRFNLSQTTGGNSGDGKYAIYAISEVLTVRYGDSDPTLLPSSIVDNRDGDPVAIDEQVTYTITFSKDMDDTTVTAEDFGNAGTSDITFGTVAEIGAGVFSVQVTPTTAGTLQLMVKKDAVLADETAAANALDTSAAILDDTILMVDNMAPMLASTDIVDDQGGVSVAADTLVTYTVTFNEHMDASTVTSDDFDNGGTAPVTINIIDISEAETGVSDPTPKAFTLEVTPTGGGTLQLRIKQDAILKDVAGNNLDTTSAILDNTTITVTGSVSNPFDTWVDGSNFDDDTNGDGVVNGLAWVLGAADVNAAATDLLPTVDNTSDQNYFIFTFRRADEANDHSDTTIVVEYGTTLSSNGWVEAVHHNNNVIITETNNGYSAGIDKVEVKLKRSTLASDGKFFVRLRVEQVAP